MRVAERWESDHLMAEIAYIIIAELAARLVVIEAPTRAKEGGVDNHPADHDQEDDKPNHNGNEAFPTIGVVRVSRRCHDRFLL
ncbi:MAG TPA: hypothetical protein VM223_04470 [Planctomycetota bacterium]|nr:hypothetical protein [Planctomycetota bacterium]